MSAPSRRRVVPLHAAVTRIGRADDNQVQIAVAQVSKCRAEIERRESDFILRDVGSKAGTYCNDQPVTEHRLRDGDRIALGRSSAATLVCRSSDPGSAGTGGHDSGPSSTQWNVVSIHCRWSSDSPRHASLRTKFWSSFRLTQSSGSSGRNGTVATTWTATAARRTPECGVVSGAGPRTASAEPRGRVAVDEGARGEWPLRPRRVSS
ncbi:MAG: FHA domain-containing protein [Planctomycetes bacterium]|nr:FHA domain-containing protein [Planctomycetota bacterium]